MYQRASAGGGGSDWYNVILLTTAPGAAITITDGDEEIEATGTGSQQAIAIHDESSTYTISVAVNGFTKSGTSVATGTTSGVIFEREVAFAEVTLTYDDDFRSQSGTISDGTTTANYTFPASDNETTIYIPSTGTWNVYCNVSGEDYKSSDIVVTSLSDSYTSDIHVRPNGKTVTPTDDIQTWLECGGVKGKFYTTLDEVLADHDTLQKLISDENAVDYMVRSKTWIEQTKIPTLTADSSKVTVSGTGSYGAKWKPFDNNWECSVFPGGGDIWFSNSHTNAWISYDFETPKIVKVVKLRPAQQNGGSSFVGVKDFKVQYSDDGTNWTDEGTSFTHGNNTDAEIFTLGNDVGAHRYWRIYVLNSYDVSASSNFYISIANLQFYSIPNADQGITEDETAMRYIGKRNYAADTLLADSNPSLVPIMTDNTHPSGEAFGSDDSRDATMYGFFKAFVGDPTSTTGWTSGVSAKVPQYVGYHFDTPTIVQAVDLVGFQGNAARLKDFKIQGSNDGFVSDINDLFTGQNPNDYNIHSYSFSNDDEYEYYRIYITSSWEDSGTNYNCAGVAYAKFYGKPLSELQWLDAILDSNYTESVLSSVVPTMTGNTTPEGECTASQNDNIAFQAFDGIADTSDTSHIWGLPNNTHLGWVQYKFTSAKTILALKMMPYYKNVKDFVIEASNDNFVSDIHTLGVYRATEQSGSNNVFESFIIQDPGSYQYYRFRGTGNTYANSLAVCEIKYLARVNVDETKIDIYGAAGAAVSYKNGNSWSPLTTLENDGHKQIAKSSLPAGVSQLEMKTDVAKDPDDLTADFTKKVNIFDGLIEIMMRPDGEFSYWYGVKGSLGLDVMESVSSSYINWNTTNAKMTGANGAMVGLASTKLYSKGQKLNLQYKASGGNASLCAKDTRTITAGGDIDQSLDSATDIAMCKLPLVNMLNKPTYANVWTGNSAARWVEIYGMWFSKPNPASNFFSAAKDTVYYTQGGVDVVVAETDDFGGAIVDLRKIPDGVTLYSSVAKDPDSLATTPVAYSKVYHEPSNGKFYLMPEGEILYWYGYKPNLVSTKEYGSPTDVVWEQNDTYITVHENTNENGGWTSPNGIDVPANSKVNIILENTRTYFNSSLRMTSPTVTSTPAVWDVSTAFANMITAANTVLLGSFDVTNAISDAHVVINISRGYTFTTTMYALWIE